MNKNEYQKKYYLKNKEKKINARKKNYLKNKGIILKQKKEYYLKNKDIILDRVKKYSLKNKSYIKDYNKKYIKKWASKNRNKLKEYINSYQINRKQKDINFRILCNLRLRQWQAIKKNLKSANTTELSGCSIKKVKTHLEKNFQPGMSWNNYGLFGWHIDHIKPCSLFNLSKEKEQKKCFNYSNLQPLWAKDNLSKRDKF